MHAAPPIGYDFTMPSPTDNPFALLTFIVAPAILTNASSVMALGTSNRFARAIDRARNLANALDRQDGPDGSMARELRVRQLRYALRRVLLLVRALTSFYLSVGSFAATSLVSLLGAVSSFLHWPAVETGARLASLGIGSIGVMGLVTGSAVLVYETRLTLRILRDETAHLMSRAETLPATPL